MRGSIPWRATRGCRGGHQLSYPSLSQSLLNGLVHNGEGAAADRCHCAGHLVPRTFLHVGVCMPGQQSLQVALCKVLCLPYRCQERE
jgi:hypothetical protein